MRRAHLIAGIAHKLGPVVMLAVWARGAALLYLQFSRRNSNAIEKGSSRA